MRHNQKLPANKLELGRACVHPNYRNGITIALLWEGIQRLIYRQRKAISWMLQHQKPWIRMKLRADLSLSETERPYLGRTRGSAPGKIQVPGFKRHLKHSHTSVDNLTPNQMKEKTQHYWPVPESWGKSMRFPSPGQKPSKCIDFLP
jgi:hypothetical protein